MAKMHPFWWLRGVYYHPSYVCWYNNCQDIDEWAMGASFVGSIDNSDKKEGSGCSAFVVAAGAAAYHSATKAVTVCDEWFAFWAQISHTPYVELFRFIVDSDNYFGIYSTASDTWAAIVRLGGVNMTDDSEISIDVGGWIWCEIRKYESGGSWHYHFYINGTPFIFMARTGDVGDPVDFRVSINREVGVTHGAKVDYIRNSDRQEYPPW